MLEKLCFDIGAVVILLIMAFILIHRKYAADKAGKQFLAIAAVTIIAAVTDIFANLYDGNVSYELFNYVNSGLYHVARVGTFFIYARYILTSTGAWYKNRNKIIRALSYAPLVFCTILVLTAFHNHIAFYYLNGHYVRGKGFLIIYLCDALYFIQALYIIARSFKIIGVRKAVALASCALLTIVSAVIQFNIPYLYVDLIGFTISLLFMILFIDNPDEKIDSVVLLKKEQVYTEDINNLFFVGIPFDIIHITIRNNREIAEMLSYSYYVDFKKKLADKLREIVKSKKVECELYYTRDGKYRVILYGNDLDKARDLASDICAVFNSEIRVNESNVSVLSAIAITQCPQDFNNLQDLLAFGGAAQMFEKVGQVLLTKDNLLEDISSIRSHIDKYIERGLLEGGFKVFYQPILDIKKWRINTVETKLKLLDREKGIIDPSVFMEVAEHNGSIIEIGTYVLEDVCRFVSSKEFAATGINKVYINASVVQCIQNGFANQVISILEKYNVSPDKIGFEITESLASDKQKAFADNLRILSEYGIDLTLDNYGYGYSNIITLSTMPIKAIKFSKRFIETDKNERLKVILENSIEMVKSLGKEIIIDGVDDEAAIHRFGELGCDKIQGSFNNLRPMPENMLCMFYADLYANYQGD